MYTKKTLRKMASQPQSRKVAEIINEAEGAIRKLKKLLPVIQHMEMKSKALTQSLCPKNSQAPVDEQAELEIKPSKNSKETDIRSGVKPAGWDDLGKEETLNGS